MSVSRRDILKGSLAALGFSALPGGRLVCRAEGLEAFTVVMCVVLASSPVSADTLTLDELPASPGLLVRGRCQGLANEERTSRMSSP